MVALALPRRNKDSGSAQSTPLTESPPPTANGNRTSDKQLSDAMVNDPDLHGKQPKRTSSFGKGLGLASLTSSMSRAGDVMQSLGRKSGNSTPQSPAPISPADNVSGAAAALSQISSNGNSAAGMGPPMTPDPSHLSHFSLKLSDLVNKAFVPCAPGAAPPAPSLSVAGGVASAAKSATTGHSAFHGVPKLQNVSYEGKRLPDKAKVIEIAHCVVGELRYAESVDPYLLRAVSRQILKALTLFASRIDSLLVSPTKDPLAVKIPSNAKEGTHLPAAMEYNLGLVTLEWIVEDSLERCIEGDRDAQGNLIADENGLVLTGMPHFVSEILTPVRKKMEGTILHIIQPILVQTKASLTRCISAAVPTPFVGPVAISPVSTPGPATGTGEVSNPLATPPGGVAGSASPPLKSAEVSASAAAALPSAVGSLQSAWLRELEGRLEGIRRLLIPRVEERCGQDGEGWFISVAIHLIWKGLLILTSRSVSVPALSNASDQTIASTLAHASQPVDGVHNQRRAPTPAQLSQALKSVGVGKARSASKDSSSSVPNSGIQTPVPLGSDVDLAKVPAISLVSPKHCAHQLAELQVFEKLVIRFCEGFLKKTGTQGPKKSKRGAMRAKLPFFASQGGGLADLMSVGTIDLDDFDPDDEDELARAALAEAMHALKSTMIVLQTMDKEPGAICEALAHICEDRRSSSQQAASNLLSSEASRALDAIPNLLLLQILYNRLPLAPGRLDLPSPPAIFGYTWGEYEKAIAGFAGGEAWAQALVQRMIPEVEAAWKLVSVREAERAAACGRNRSSLARVSSQPSDSESEASVAVDDSMTQSAPTLEKRPDGAAEQARSSETDLSARDAAKPKFWRRSSSGRGAFHLTLSSLSRSSSPRPRQTSESEARPSALDSVHREAEFERKSLRLFALALEFVGQQQVQIP